MKMPRAAALVVSGLVGLACGNSGLKSTAHDAAAAGGGHAGGNISSGTTGGAGGQGSTAGSPSSQGGICTLFPMCNPGDYEIGMGDCPAERQCYSLSFGCGSIQCMVSQGVAVDAGASDVSSSNRGGGAAGSSGTGGTGGSSATGGTLSTGGVPGSGGAPTGGASSTCGNAVLTPGGLCSGFRWAASASANSITLYFGSGTTFPEYVTIDTCSSYTRFVYGPLGGWGSSVILAPVFWTADGLQQAKYINTQIYTTCDQALIVLAGTLAGLSFSGTLSIDAPANDKLTAHVSMTTSGTVTLATDRPWEAFKPVMISTMYESSTVWDADYATIGNDTYPLSTSGWVVSSPVATTHFGVVGGDSSWKANAPTVAIDLAGVSSPLVTGWMTQSADPNDDNGSLWAATTDVQSSWSYDITVSQ